MPEALKKLIHSLSYFPGIWDNKATKLAFFLLHAHPNFIAQLQDNISDIQKSIWTCQRCYGLTDAKKDVCKICQNPDRNQNQIAVVEEYMDMLTLEHSGGYQGVYHVLWWAISPINGVFIGDLHFEGLFQRIHDSDENIELILATNPNIEGEATAQYIKGEIEKRAYKHKTRLTRLSRGLASGYLEYADALTIMSAINERKEW